MRLNFVPIRSDPRTIFLKAGFHSGIVSSKILVFVKFMKKRLLYFTADSKKDLKKIELQFLNHGRVKADNEWAVSHETSTKRLRLEEKSASNNKTVKYLKVCKLNL